MSSILIIKAKPRSKQPGVTIEADGTIVVATGKPPANDAANTDILEQLADHLGLAKSRLTLVSGHASRLKKIRVE